MAIIKGFYEEDNRPDYTYIDNAEDGREIQSEINYANRGLYVADWGERAFNNVSRQHQIAVKGDRKSLEETIEQQKLFDEFRKEIVPEMLDGLSVLGYVPYAPVQGVYWGASLLFGLYNNITESEKSGIEAIADGTIDTGVGLFEGVVEPLQYTWNRATGNNEAFNEEIEQRYADTPLRGLDKDVLNVVDSLGLVASLKNPLRSGIAHMREQSVKFKTDTALGGELYSKKVGKQIAEHQNIPKDVLQEQSSRPKDANKQADNFGSLDAETKEYLEADRITSGFNRARDSENRLNVSYEENPLTSVYGEKIKVQESTLKYIVTDEEVILSAREITDVRAHKLGEDFNGRYNTITKGVEIDESLNFEVLAHEIGHAVDDVMEFEGCTKELERGTVAKWKNNEYPPEYHRGEGIAEFFRTYAINETQAMKDFPEFYNTFKRAMVKEPELASKIEGFCNKYRKWQQQRLDNPEQSVMASIHNKEIVDADKTIKQKVAEGIKAFTDKVVGDMFYENYKAEKAVDKLIKKNGLDIVNPIENMTNNEYLAQKDACTLLGVFDYCDRDITMKLLEKKFNCTFNNVTLEDVKKRLEAFANSDEGGKYLDKLGKNRKDELHTGADAFNILITALNERDLIVSKSKQNKEYVAPRSLEELQKVIDDAPSELMEIAKDYSKFVENLRNILVSVGSIKKEQAEVLAKTRPYYAPLTRSELLENIETNNTIKLNTKVKKGSTASTLPPLESITEVTASVMAMANRQLSLKEVAKLTELGGSTKLIRKVDDIEIEGHKEKAKPTNGYFYVFENGEKRYYQSVDPALISIVSSLEPLTAKATVTLIEKCWASCTALLRNGITLAFEFMVNNIMLDSFSTAIYTPAKMFSKSSIPIVNTLYGAYKMLTDKELTSEYMASGGHMGSFKDRIVDIKDDMSFATARGNSNPRKLRKGWRRFKHGWRAVTSASEDINRLAVFADLRKQGLNATEASLSLNRSIVDYRKAGTFMKKYGKYLPFFNAGYRFLASFAYNIYHHFPKVLAGGVLWQVIPELLSWMQLKDDEEYQNIPLEDKQKYFYMRLSPDMPLTRFKRVPYVGQLGAFTGAFLNYTYAYDSRAIEDFSVIKAIRNDFTAVDVPPMLKTILEQSLNYDMFTGRPIVPPELEKKSAELQYTPYSSEVGKLFGQYTGVSPMRFDHAVRGLFGTLGTTIKDMPNDFLRDENAYNPEWYEKSRFFHKKLSTRTRGEEILDKELEVMEKEKSIADSEGRYYDKQFKLDKYRRTKQDLGKLKGNVPKIIKNKTTTRAEKKRRLLDNVKAIAKRAKVDD